MKNKKNTQGVYLFLLLIVLCTLGGCASSKKVVYFQNLENEKLLERIAFKEVKIKKDDILSILVSGPDKEVVQPYNFTIVEGNSVGDFQRSTVGYLVNNLGEIKFPLLGKIKVEGMTRTELEEYLTAEIGKDVKNPIVSVTFKNFKITVLGEVRTPGTFSVTSDKINILQAFGMAGDLLITGKRENILLIREVDGRQAYVKIDLKSKDILESPYFYLQQNDVIYVPPSTSRIAQGRAATGVWATIISAGSMLLTIVALLIK
ncbi:MAG: polysaccharide biosynthesis/export family protein [Bacteroidales bacterium]